jgi:protein SCO1
MANFMEKNWFKAGITIILLLIIASFGYRIWVSSDQGSSRLIPLTNEKGEDNRTYAADFELKDTKGQTVKLSDYDDKVKLVYFFFSFCPDVCPLSTQNLTEVQNLLIDKKLFGDKAHMLSISFDPKRDTAERLQQFSDSYGVKPEGWTFLRGDDEEQMKKLAEQYGIGVLKDDKGNFMHTNIVLLVDKNGVIRAYYDILNEELTADMIVKDMKKLTKEK